MKHFLSTLLCILCIFATSALDSMAAVTSSATTPDGSLWMGTDGDGLLRVGRNGRRLVYRSAASTFPSDSIRSLVCDPSGTLWLLCQGGSLTTYRSTAGFVPFEGLSSPVTCVVCYGEGIVASTEDSKLFRLSSSDSPVLISSTASPVLAMCPSSDAALWLLGKSSLGRLSPEGEVTSLGDVAASVSGAPLGFEYETKEAASAPAEKPSAPVWPYLLIALLSVGLLIALIYTVSIRRKLSSRAPSYPRAVEKAEPRISETSVPAVKAPVRAPAEAPVKAPVPSPAPVHVPSPAPAQALSSAPVQPVKPADAPVQSPAQTSAQTSAPAPVQTSAPVPAAEPAHVPAPKPASSFYQEVLLLVERNYIHPDYGVEELADALGLSRIHLNRKLKAEAGTSPSTMLKEVRMKHAIALLDEGRLSVAEIAAACGFSTPSYFSTAFREYCGKTPSEYLAALQQES